MAVPPILHAEHRLIRILRREGADEPGAARPLNDLTWMQGRALKRLVEMGVIRHTGDGRYWVDARAREILRQERLRRALVGAMVGVATAIALALAGLIH